MERVRKIAVAERMIKNSRGQALIEFSIAIPVFMVMAAGLLFLLYFLTVTYWTDHWAYRSNMCLIEGSSQCQSKLEQKLQVLIPQDNYQVLAFWKTPLESQVSVRLQFAEVDFHFTKFGFQKEIHSHIRLPLRSKYSPTTMDSP